MAVSPPVPLAAEKQRRLCLAAAHVDCATYAAAIASHAPAGRHDRHARPVARMTPVILDHGRFDLRLPTLRADRGTGQAALVALLGLALVAILVARPSGNPGAIPPNATAAPSAGASSVPTEVAGAPSVTPSPDATPTESPATPTPPVKSSQAPASAAPSAASSEPVTSGATYKVKSGDTLSAIAARFGTTTRVLVRLNGITDPSRLKVGQILKLP
jgi:LysM repeat protein